MRQHHTQPPFYPLTLSPSTTLAPLLGASYSLWSHPMTSSSPLNIHTGTTFDIIRECDTRSFDKFYISHQSSIFISQNITHLQREVWLKQCVAGHVITLPCSGTWINWHFALWFIQIHIMISSHVCKPHSCLPFMQPTNNSLSQATHNFTGGWSLSVGGVQTTVKSFYH